MAKFKWNFFECFDWTKKKCKIESKISPLVRCQAWWWTMKIKCLEGYRFCRTVKQAQWYVCRLAMSHCLVREILLVLVYRGESKNEESLSFPIEKSSLLCVNGTEIGDDPGKTWSSLCVEKKLPLHTLSCFAQAWIVLCTPAIDKNGRQHNSKPF